jgi:type II secretory pathway component GspD/PulD (secretin)
MKFIKKQLIYGSLLLLMPMLASCISDSQSTKSTPAPMEDAVSSVKSSATPSAQASLPVRYQTPSYLVDKKPEKDASIAEEAKLKVEAKISSTRGPQPLWDIMKRLASLKGMNVSWASDVDRNVLVDVNINANDDFFAAIDNLLRQVDYFHEMQGNTIIVKYKETRQFHIAMPFIKQTYKTKTGGDVLGGGSNEQANTNVAGEISLSTEGVAITNQKDGSAGGIEFNTWNSIENNLNSVLDIWSTETVTKQDSTSAATEEEKKKSAYNESSKVAKDSTTEQSVSATYRRSKSGNTYFIDKPVGLVTVTAPRPIIEKLDVYFKSLRRELYKQVAIEAKILEVQLDDSSSIGLNWNKILSSLSVASGTLSGGKTYSKTKTDTEDRSDTFSNTRTQTDTQDSSFTSTNTRNRTYDNLAGVPITADGGTIADVATDSAGSLLTNVAETVATSGVSAATVIANGLTGSLGGTISLAAFTFDSFLNAVSKQGKATILSNPKLSVLNGQPSLITVGKNVTYISNITSDVSDSGVITYSAETARALSGIGLALTANILDDNQIILNLVPVTSELLEPIEYRPVGLGTVGLPVINVREMSTTVKVKNGEMLVIGGLISSVSENEGTFIPGTSNLSFFKYLFGAETKLSTKRELIILLKPRII